MEIRNTGIDPHTVPSTFVSIAELEPFALSFDGYAHWGDRCGRNAEAAAMEFGENGNLPTKLSDLRACLFYEHQRWRWERREPDPQAVAYLQALLDAIRVAASRG